MGLDKDLVDGVAVLSSDLGHTSPALSTSHDIERGAFVAWIFGCHASRVEGSLVEASWVVVSSRLRGLSLILCASFGVANILDVGKARGVLENSSQCSGLLYLF